jgi:sigma-B regulation protein RsbU (phosphoserine phosphatase)
MKTPAPSAKKKPSAEPDSAAALAASQKQVQQLSLLFEATRLLNSTLDLGELLELILKIARTEVGADRGTVFLVDNKHKELWSIVASGLDHQEIRVPLGQGVAGQVAQTGVTVSVEDAYSLPYHDHSFDQKFSYKTRSILSLPIRHHTGEIVGVLQLLNKTSGPRFTAEDEDFLNKLSGHMAMALENARLHRESLEKQRLEKELALARGIQRSLLPDSPPVVPGYEISVLNEPCFEVGGDYYDFLNLGPQSLLLVVADVEGKGVSSALVMSNLQASLRALVMHLHSLEVVTVSLNEMIFNDTKSKKFLSLFLGLVDTRRNGLHYINAGHVPPLLIRGDQGEFRQLSEGGTVVGLFPQTEYTRGSVKLATGDVLVCCTDGIVEASNAQEDEYGSDRLAACVARHRAKSASAIVDAVSAEVTAFSRGGSHVDDKVLMVTKVTKEGLVNSGNVSPMG